MLHFNQPNTSYPCKHIYLALAIFVWADDFHDKVYNFAQKETKLTSNSHPPPGKKLTSNISSIFNLQDHTHSSIAVS
jgi:hypothetical protein